MACINIFKKYYILYVRAKDKILGMKGKKSKVHDIARKPPVRRLSHARLLSALYLRVERR